MSTNGADHNLMIQFLNSYRNGLVYNILCEKDVEFLTKGGAAWAVTPRDPPDISPIFMDEIKEKVNKRIYKQIIDLNDAKLKNNKKELILCMGSESIVVLPYAKGKTTEIVKHEKNNFPTQETISKIFDDYIKHVKSLDTFPNMCLEDKAQKDKLVWKIKKSTPVTDKYIMASDLSIGKNTAESFRKIFQKDQTEQLDRLLIEGNMICLLELNYGTILIGIKHV